MSLLDNPKLVHRNPSPFATHHLGLHADCDEVRRAASQESTFSAGSSVLSTPRSRPTSRHAIDHHATPVPYLKALPLLLSRVSEGLVFSVIFPYINEMFLSFGVPEKSVGVWSATAVSLICGHD